MNCCRSCTSAHRSFAPKFLCRSISGTSFPAGRAASPPCRAQELSKTGLHRKQTIVDDGRAAHEHRRWPTAHGPACIRRVARGVVHHAVRERHRAVGIPDCDVGIRPNRDGALARVKIVDLRRIGRGGSPRTSPRPAARASPLRRTSKAGGFSSPGMPLAICLNVAEGPARSFPVSSKRRWGVIGRDDLQVAEAPMPARAPPGRARPARRAEHPLRRLPVPACPCPAP